MRIFTPMQQPAYIPYLTLNDYLTTIRSGQFNNQLLDDINEGGEFERQESESFALDEVHSVLGSYFYLDFEFRPTLPFYWNKKYYAGDRIVLDFQLWIGSQAKISGIVNEEGSDGIGFVSYNIGDCVIYPEPITGKNAAWICMKENSDSNWNQVNWIQIGYQYDLYFVQFPYPIFQLIPSPQIGIETPGLYCVGDRVSWERKLYCCIQQSLIPGHQYREQFYSINDIPSPNVFPNMRIKTNPQWLDKGEYYLKNIYPTYPSNFDQVDINDDKNAWDADWIKTWIKGDNRSNTMKQIVIALSISKLTSRNSYVQKERSINRDWAMRKLERIRKGEDTTLIPILQPEQIGDISWGGMPKVRNTF